MRSIILFFAFGASFSLATHSDKASSQSVSAGRLPSPRPPPVQYASTDAHFRDRRVEPPAQPPVPPKVTGPRENTSAPNRHATNRPSDTPPGSVPDLKMEAITQSPDYILRGKTNE
jgi:hypothetical protein